MLVKIEGHTVPHFEAPVYAKVELCGLECSGTFSVQTSLLNFSHLLHIMGFVPTKVGITVTFSIHKSVIISSSFFTFSLKNQ